MDFRDIAQQQFATGDRVLWTLKLARPPGAGLRDLCALWYGALSDNDEPIGGRFGDVMCLAAMAGPQRIEAGWRIVAPEDAGGWIRMSLRAPPERPAEGR